MGWLREFVKDKLGSPTEKRKPVVDPTGDEDIVFINGSGTFAMEVVGESHYQEALERASGGRTEDGVEVVVRATLVPEDDNPYDEEAVAVVVNGEKVGYLPRIVAPVFRHLLGQWEIPEGYPVCCNAKIVGGWSRKGGLDRGSFGIKLDFSGG